MTYTPVIIKERIYASNGKLIRCDGNYNVKATDVRFIKFDKNKIKLEFVYAKNKKVSQIVAEKKADYGFNFPFFYNGTPLGDSKDNDKVISSAYGKMLNWHEFASVNGKPVIGQLRVSDKQDFLVQGAPLLVENGKPVYESYRVSDQVQDDIGKSRCQRTFVGIDANGDLLLGIADGRTSSDQGLTLEEMALYMISKGAVIALNGDGGGSTILADKTGGLNQKLNTGANERVVHHAVLVYLLQDAPETKTPVTESPSNSKGITHKVVKGDTLYSLSVKYKVSVDEIKVLNNLTNNTLTIGMELIIVAENKGNWQVELGNEAVNELAKAGLISNPETWTGNKMLESAQNWLLFTLIKRLHEKK